METRKPYLSVVIPIFNEEDNISELSGRLKKVMTEMGHTYEIIFIDDGSMDNSLNILKQFQAVTSGITIIEFNRNYGQHAAIFAGFERSSGEIVITLDADLQNPPEEIPKLVSKAEEGFEVIATVRMKRKDSIFRRCASYIINRITAKITGVKLKDYGCMLRAYRKNIVKLMCASKEISTFIPVLATSYAKKTAEIQVKHDARSEGESKYSLMRLISLQFDLMTSFSVWPLRMLMFLGLAVSLAGVGFGIFLFAMRILMGVEWAVNGVFTLFAVLFFFVGTQFLAFGLLGEYIGRIYAEVRKRPRFVIEKIYSREEDTNS
ncbi:MAG: glycosyltransferase [Candidatus Scalindua sp.]|nr:glycosyltransferase [Candidatus Scalindua sp.]MCR4345139.1 glycosyltransferase [Candidatus Scalindua sp.]